MKLWTLGASLSATMVIACSSNNVIEDTGDTGETGVITSCFIAGTRVLTEHGTKPIEDIRPGDRVWSWDTEEAQPVLRGVLQKICGEASETYRIQAGEQIIEGVTAEHPFWIPKSQTWELAGTLQAGMDVLCWHGQHEAKTLSLHTPSQTTHPTPVKVYTLSVEGPEHNFFAEGILVHNKSPVPECWRLDLPDGTMVDFGDVPSQSASQKEVTLTVIPIDFCDWLSEEERQLTLELDNPDGVFSLSVTSIDLFLVEEETTFTIGFAPTEAKAFEGQLRTSTPQHAVHNPPTLQLFGRGNPSEE